MFCPRCGSNQSEGLKFCNLCGANLYAVRKAVDTRETEEKFDWSKTWLAEMFLSQEENKKRKEELERQRGITPEIKRYNEIKAGVITSCVGFGVMIFLYFLMQGIIRSGEVSASEAEIISRIWIAGVIPIMVGLALIINGLFVSKKQVEIAERNAPTDSNILEKGPNQKGLRPADTNEFIPTGFSVTEGTTRHLKNSSKEQ